MWPLVLNFMRAYAPYITLPAAAVIGFVGYVFVGYNIEKQFRTPPPPRPSTEELRNERLLKEILESDNLAPDPIKDKTFVPKSVFEKNVSPAMNKTE